MPPVSKVFHSQAHVHNHLSCLRGDQPQSGHRIPEPRLLLSSSTRLSGTMTGLPLTGAMPLLLPQPDREDRAK